VLTQPPPPKKIKINLMYSERLKGKPAQTHCLFKISKLCSAVAGDMMQHDVRNTLV